jgi:hypothetical protein
MKRATIAMLIAALALIPASPRSGAAQTGTLSACLRDPDRDGDGRVLRIVGPNEPCRRRETRVSWNVTGPAGPTGPEGPAGPSGPAGQDGGGLPAGAVSFFALEACPVGWSEFLAAQGRYLVGLPPNGTLGAEVGVALVDQEDRPVGAHTHGVNDPGHAHRFFDLTAKLLPTISSSGGFHRAPGGEDLFSNSVGHDVEWGFTGVTINAAGTVGGTNAPYIQLLSCMKD